MRNNLNSLLISLAFAVTANATWAAELVYTPVNPTFGGNALNSSHLMGLANAQNEHKAPATAASGSQQFVQMLQSQLYAGLANKVANAIFGTNAQNQGTYTFDNQTVSFVNTGTTIDVTITNTTTGEVSKISVPSGS